MEIDDKGRNNQIIGAPTEGSRLTVRFLGGSNHLEFGDNVNIVSGEILFRFHDQSVRIVGANRLTLAIYLAGRGANVEIGRGTKSNSLLWMNLGETGDTVTIGNDCLFSNTRLRTSDSHPIYDMETNARTNPSGPISIRDHVWVGEDVLILGGSDVGAGSVVGAKSLVKGTLPENALCVGTPARVVRTNIRWAETI